MLCPKHVTLDVQEATYVRVRKSRATPSKVQFSCPCTVARRKMRMRLIRDIHPLPSLRRFGIVRSRYRLHCVLHSPTKLGVGIGVDLNR